MVENGEYFLEKTMVIGSGIVEFDPLVFLY